MTTIPAPPFRRFSATVLAVCAAGLATAQTPAKLDPPVKPTVSGKFLGNGKNAVLKFISVSDREPFSDKEALTLVFTEKDPAASKKPSMDAMFGRLGSALTLQVHHDGGIFGCEVSHSAHSKRGFSAIGKIKMTEYKIAGGNVSGRVTTGGELDAFGEKWDVDLTFAAPMPEKLRRAPGVAAKPVAGEPGATPATEPKQATGPLIPARKLPLPTDATNVDYKVSVRQVYLSSPRSVDAVTKELATSLKQQGWKDGGGSVMTRQNAILKREQGDARLTIMIQTAPAGSTVKFFTDGLDWSGITEVSPAAPRLPAAQPTVKDIEAEANKALKDAFKNLPKGF
jgi:hypothetical protein